MLLEVAFRHESEFEKNSDRVRMQLPIEGYLKIAAMNYDTFTVRYHLDSELTQEQQNWLRFDCEELGHIASYTIVDDAAEPQPSLIDAILATLVHQVPSNGNNRFYMEPEADKRWDSLHHLVDLHDNGVMDSKLTIHQFNSSNESSSVHLSYNEVDELLAILFQWRMSHEDKRVEDAKPDNALGDLNKHPF